MRQHEQNEEQHHADRCDQHEQRILHGVRQLAAHRLGTHPLLAQQLQDLVQRARNFADPHQGHIHRRKQRRMRTSRLGKALAAQERRAQFANDGAQTADIGIVGEQFERVVEPCAGLQQQGKIAGEGRDLRSTGLAEDAKSGGRRGGARLLHRLDRQQPQIFDAGRDFGRGRRRQRAVDDFAALCQRAVAEIRHGSPHRRDAEYFGRVVRPARHLAIAVIEHRGHAAAHRRLIDVMPIGLRADQLAHLVGRFRGSRTRRCGRDSRCRRSARSRRLAHTFAGREAERREARIVGKIGLR